jgi:glycoside hydrolase-like protein
VQYAGFDTSIYPGDAAMRAWLKPNSPYEWSGYYLAAPCHKDPSWSGKRATLQTMGWGLAVIFVGQQTFDGVPIISDSRATIIEDVGTQVTCSRTLLSKDQGTIDADDAISKTSLEGFPAGTVIYLDLEHMDAIPSTMEDYYRAWIDRVIVDGKYRPGIYCHHFNASAIYSGATAAAASVGSAENIPFWIASTIGFSMNKRPTDVGFSFASMWQGILGTSETWNGVTLALDVDIADTRSPSAPK